MKLIVKLWWPFWPPTDKVNGPQLISRMYIDQKGDLSDITNILGGRATKSQNVVVLSKIGCPWARGPPQILIIKLLKLLFFFLFYSTKWNSGNQ